MLTGVHHPANSSLTVAEGPLRASPRSATRSTCRQERVLRAILVGGVAGPRTTWRLTPQAAVLLIAAAIAWVAIIAWSRGQGHAGTMGLTLPAFLVAWTVMMAAMMLPSVAPVASLYARSIAGRRGLRLTLFTSGYLVVWATAGVVAFALGALIAGLAGETRGSGPRRASPRTWRAACTSCRHSSTAACRTADRRCRCSSTTARTRGRCATSEWAPITAPTAWAAAGR